MGRSESGSYLLCWKSELICVAAWHWHSLRLMWGTDLSRKMPLDPFWSVQILDLFTKRNGVASATYLEWLNLNTDGQRTLFNPNLGGIQFQEYTQCMYFKHASLQSSTGRPCHKYVTSFTFCIFIFKSTQVKRLKKCIFMCQLIFFSWNCSYC